MNRLACHVCQQQFKTVSGLSWHLDRIHERSAGQVSPSQSSGGVSSQGAGANASERINHEGGPGVSLLRDLSLEADVKHHYAEISERREVAESIRRLSQDMRAVKRRLSDIEIKGTTRQALATEIDSGAASDREVRELIHAALQLVRALDRPNREPTILLDLATGVVTSLSDLSRAREVVKAFLRRSKPGMRPSVDSTAV